MPSEKPTGSADEVAEMGCPEASDTSENSSVCCLGGSSVLLNSARTQRVTSGRLAIIPPAAPRPDRLRLFKSCPSKMSCGNRAHGGATFKKPSHRESPKY